MTDQKRKRLAITWFTIFIVGMVVFTYGDLPIAKAIYHPNAAFGRVFQIIGLLPTCIAGIFFAISNLLTIRIAKSRILTIIVSCLALFVFIGFPLLSVVMLDIHSIGMVCFFVIVFIPFSMVANRAICSRARVVELRKVMLIALFAALVAVVGQTLIKFAFNRPRFVNLTNPDLQFTRWYVHFPFTPDSSFPSGHAAQASLSFLTVFLKEFIPRLRTRKWNIFFWSLSIFITTATMLSRMILGAHYATDVWAGSFLTLGTISFSCWYVDKMYTEKKD